MTAPLVVLGDVLLDVDLLGEVRRQCPDAPAAPVLDLGERRTRPGGAGLAALLAAATGTPVRLVTALADDTDGAAVAELLSPRVSLVVGPALGSTPVKCRLRAGGGSLARVDRGDGIAGPSVPAMREALDGAAAVLVSDYGRGVAADAALREALAGLAADVPVVWDPHPRGPTPVPDVTLATPNLDEALRAGGRPRAHADDGCAPITAAELAARRVRVRWAARAVAVTLGGHGALLTQRDGAARLLPAPSVEVTDPCGAGDAFAAAVAVALRAGLDQVAAVRSAVTAAARFVSSGGAAALGDGGPAATGTVERRRA